jgi:hypothetical protein
VRPRFLLLAGIPLLALGFRAQPSRDVLVLDHPRHVRLWGRFEATAWLAHEATNPFDPAQVDLRGEFAAPDGTHHEIPGFVTRDFERELVGGFEKLRPRGPLAWKVRFTPTQTGGWRFRLRVVTPQGSDASPWRRFRVRPAAPGRHGFLRTSPLDLRYLRFDDGTPYFAVGENLAWYDGRGTFAYDDWLAKLAAEGVNYVRLWMPSWAFGLEWIEREDGAIVSNSLGDYTDRLDRAWQLDYVLEEASRHGIQVMLCLQNHGPFSLDANSQWADNPYNAANGGPLARPLDFFDDPTARALFKRRLRYVVARWGYATNLLAWELWNEVNLAASTILPEVQAWHAEMARELLALDPWDHMITTSVSLGEEQNALWHLPEIAFTQTHTYNVPFLLDTGFLLTTLSARVRVEGKPTLIGETGADYRGPAETLATDPSHIGFHDGLWVGVLAETFGTGMSWWWDNVIDPQNLYGHFGAVARFVEGVAFDEPGFVATRPAAGAAGRSLTAYALVGERVTLVWIKNLAHHFAPEGNPGDPVPVAGATLLLEGLADGAWSARWIDAYTGGELRRDAVEVAGGAVELAVPDFVGDVALRLERKRRRPRGFR